MAHMVLLASFVSIAGNDLSAHADKIELSIDVEDKDATTFASAGWKESLGGLKGGKLGVSFKQDVAAASLDSIVWPLLGTVVAFEVRLANTARSPSNPGYTGNVLVNGWKPISGSVGDVAATDVSFPTTGPVARQTT
jgi:hypothetical protein